MLSVVVCSIEGRKRLALWGALAARSCWEGGGRTLFFGGSSRCAGLLDQRKEEAASFDGDLPLHGAAGMGEAAFWGAPAARGCSIKGRGCFMGIFRCRAARSC